MDKKSLIIVLSFFTLPALGQNNKDLVAKGNEWYKKGDYKQAAELYKSASDKDPKDSVALFNLGNALRRLNQLEAAENAFKGAGKKNFSTISQSRSAYNEGVTLTRQNKLQESIDTYKKALRLNPTDQQARENLQLALNQLKKQSSSGGGNDKDKKDKKDNKENKPDRNNSTLDQQQAEQMLSALREEEKKLQQNVQKKNNNAGSNRKDW